MKLLISGIIICLTSIAYGQDDHLEPANEKIQYDGILKDYYDTVLPKLLIDLSSEPIARYLAMPSFSSEYVMSLEKMTTGDLVLKLNTFSENYWYAEDKGKVEIIPLSLKVDRELSNKLKELFELAISQTDKPEKMRVVADGVVYSFSIYTNANGLVTGEKHSPDKGTKIANLVAVCEQFRTYIKTQGQGRDKLINETVNLIARFKN